MSGLADHTKEVILVAVVAVVLLSTSGLMASELRKPSREYMCAVSLVKTAWGSGSITCQVNNVVVFNDHVEVNGQPITVNLYTGETVAGGSVVKKKTFESTEQNIKHAALYAIAEEVRKCWLSIGEGKTDILPSNWWPERDYFCVHCADLRFDESVSLERVEGILPYLETAPIGKTNYGDLTYAEYLTEGGDLKERFGIHTVESNKIVSKDHIDTRDMYYIDAVVGSTTWYYYQVIGETYKVEISPLNAEQICPVTVN